MKYPRSPIVVPVRVARPPALQLAAAALALCGLTPFASTQPRAALQEGPVAVVGARILPVVGAELESGTMIVQAGRIVALGATADIDVPAQAQVIDGIGKVLMPGLVDTHSHIGGGWAADRSAPIQPGVSVFDAIDVRSAGFQRAEAGGITTANVMPGSGHLMSGQTVYLKMRDANTIEDWVLRDEEGRMLGGMKMANGTNSRRDPPFPGTRGKAAALVRERFIEAQAYRAKLARAAEDPEQEAPDRDLGLEALVEVLEGTRIVHHHTHRHDDIMTVLRLREEFGFRVVLHHVSEGWKVADEIAAAGVPCSLILVDSPGGKLEARDLIFETGGILERAGARVAFHTDDWITDARLFLRMAALGHRAGMTRQGALESLTIAGAEMLDLDDRLGSLEPGKDADFILLDGDPFSVYTKVLETWVDGKKVFDRSRAEDRLWAVGGLGAGESRKQLACCVRSEDD